jgi:ADP-ribosylglycohydrolase
MTFPNHGDFLCITKTYLYYIKKEVNVMTNLHKAVYGFAIGDAIGLPYEFKKRGTFNCTNMRASTFQDSHFPLPLGSWSDDTSLMLCVLDALSIYQDYFWQEKPPQTKEMIEVDLKIVRQKVYNQFKDNAIAWMTTGKYTNHGYRIPFDVGNACRRGITSMMLGSHNKKADKVTSNGNGGLMRILPLAFSPLKNTEELMDYIILFNECSHNHIISHVGSLIYIRFVQEIIQNKNSTIKEILNKAINSIEKKYKIKEYSRIWDLSIIESDMTNIKSTSYVVDTLESVIWCCANNNNFKDTVLSAVNLGKDTDTIAALVGAVVGIRYDGVPEEWLSNVRKNELLTKMCDRFDRNKIVKRP